MPNYELCLTIFVKQVFQREQMFRSESTTYLVYKIQKQNKVYGFSVSISFVGSLLIFLTKH